MGEISILFVAIVVVLFLCTFRYGSQKRKVMDKSIFSVLDGTSMFLLDNIRPCKRLLKSAKIKKKFQDIYIKDKVENEIYIYVTRKISVSLLIFVGVNIIGIISLISSGMNEEKVITFLMRADETEKNYSIVAQQNTKTETVNVEVEKRKYTDEEIQQMFGDYYDSIVDKMLNKNKSVDNIVSPLVFFDSYGEENIELWWDVEDSEIVDYDGQIYADSVEKKTKIFLTMIYENVKKEYEILIKISPVKEEKKSLQDKIQEAVDKENVYEDKVKLPEEIDGEKIKYSMMSDENNIPFAILAVLLAVVIFVIKDNDLDKEEKKRKQQLESDYAQIVSKLMLLTTAGLTMKKAWYKVVEDYENEITQKKYVYEEMKLAGNKMKSGTPEGEAYREFGKRCNLHSYIKLGSILEQNIIQGTKGMRELLDYEVHEAFEQRKVIAKKRGDEAGTKMLLPMVVMLILAMVIIMVPSFLSMT